MIAVALAAMALAAQEPAAAAETPGEVASTAELFPNIERPELQPGDDAALLMGCLVQLTGALTECRVLAETPVNSGFADAAIQAAERGRLSPRTMSGVQKVTPARFVIRFRLGEDGQPASN